MKYIKARKDLIYIVNPLLIIGGILLFAYAAHIIVHLFSAFWVITVCAAFLIVTPFGNQRMLQNAEDINNRVPLPQWFFCIAIVEVTMFGVYYGISLINTQIVPLQVVPMHLFLQSLHTQLLCDGLFPWNIYALIAVGMSVLAYRSNSDAYFSQLKSFSHHTDPHTFWSLNTDTGARRATLFALSSTLLFATLLLISFILSPKIHLATGFQTSALLTTLTLLMLTFTQTVKKYITRIFANRISFILSFFVFCALLGLLLLVLSMMTAGITQQTPAQTPPTLIVRLINFNESTGWTLFSVIWWISFTPLVGGFIARLSKGYSIRSILIGVLLLPVMVSIIIAAQHHYAFTIHVPHLIAKIMALLSFFIVLPLLLNQHTTANAILSYFPKNGISKHRDSQPFFQRMAQLTIALLYFYLVIGMNGMSLFMFAPNYYAIIFLLIAGIAITKRCVQSRNK